METGFKGTRGQWIVGEHSKYRAWVDVESTEKGTIGRSFYGEAKPVITESEAIANAHLIASAPEMLEALVRIKAELLRCDILDEKTEKFIDAVVAKAVGGQS